MHPEALIIRRCYPVPVTFADLRLAYYTFEWPRENDRNLWRRAFTAALKRATSAIDEVYAVVDGREVRVAVVSDADNVEVRALNMRERGDVYELMDKADRDGYWERPREVRLDLSPRPVSHGEVARAVLVGQEALERGGVVRS